MPEKQDQQEHTKLSGKEVLEKLFSYIEYFEQPPKVGMTYGKYIEGKEKETRIYCHIADVHNYTEAEKIKKAEYDAKYKGEKVRHIHTTVLSYDKPVRDFEKLFMLSELGDRAYMQTLENYGIENEDEVEIQSADTPLLRALLTSIFRGERFCTGLIDEKIADKTIANILRRWQVLEYIENQQILPITTINTTDGKLIDIYADNILTDRFSVYDTDGKILVVYEDGLKVIRVNNAEWQDAMRQRNKSLSELAESIKQDRNQEQKITSKKNNPVK